VHIVISNTSGGPIYEQIKEQIKAAILAGELEEDAQLPSIRQLAQDLRVSVITTMRAYSELEQEGFVANVQGKGCFVLKQNQEWVREEKMRQVEGHLQKAIEAGQVLKLSYGEMAELLKLLMEET
jgi:Predicted transcriptional regulators